MAVRLGATFLRCAVGPVNFAGARIMARQVPEGLRELTPDSLYGAFMRGVEEAAKEVGVGARDVEVLLPMNDVRASAARLALAQKSALDAWNLHAGQLGGLLSGVGDLTVDGRQPDVRDCLERLASKVKRDKPLAEPLQALANEVGIWQDLVQQCRTRLDGGRELARAYRRQRLLRLGAAGLSLIAVASSALLVLWVRAARTRIDEAIANPDPCAASAIAPGDLGRASGEQQKRLDERRAACDDRKRKEQLAQEEQRRREEKEREAARARAEHEQKCAELAEHLEGGQLSADDEALAAGNADLLRRMSHGALEAADFGPSEPALPCDGTPGGAKIATVFEAAVLAAPLKWANADPSERVSALLVKNEAELPSVPKQVLAKRADDAAKRAIVAGGGGPQAERAARLCKLRAAIGLGTGSYCAILGSKRQ